MVCLTSLRVRVGEGRVDDLLALSPQNTVFPQWRTANHLRHVAPQWAQPEYSLELRNVSLELRNLSFYTQIGSARTRVKASLPVMKDNEGTHLWFPSLPLLPGYCGCEGD
jgi:hypothetical protein